jgi:hypothetical protein
MSRRLGAIAWRCDGISSSAGCGARDADLGVVVRDAALGFVSVVITLLVLTSATSLTTQKPWGKPDRSRAFAPVLERSVEYSPLGDWIRCRRLRLLGWELFVWVLIELVR